MNQVADHLDATGQRNALLIFLAGALLWGIYWVPVRTLEDMGLPGPWAGLALVATALIPALILTLVRRETAIDARQALGALAIGTAVSLYSTAITYTDVVRVILLFYFAPTWSMAIECLFFGRKWTWQSSLALAVSFAGIVVICRGEIPLQGAGAWGDWMALCAGLAWSVGAALVFSKGRPNLPLMTSLSLFGAVLVSSVSLLAAGSSALAPPALPASDLAIMLLVAAAFGGLYLAPVMLATLWGALNFAPALITFVLTAEIISGVASSAALLGEPFGLPEVLGTMLIITGALIEIIPSKPLAAPRQPGQP